MRAALVGSALAALLAAVAVPGTAHAATTTFTFTLGARSAATSVNRVAVQVCRSPVITLPPSYCGPAVTYLAPSLG